MPSRTLLYWPVVLPPAVTDIYLHIQFNIWLDVFSFSRSYWYPGQNSGQHWASCKWLGDTVHVFVLFFVFWIRVPFRSESSQNLNAVPCTLPALNLELGCGNGSQFYLQCFLQGCGAETILCRSGSDYQKVSAPALAPAPEPKPAPTTAWACWVDTI